MSAVDPSVLARLEAALESHGLLLLHDQKLPSITTLVAGAPIAGSWWAHARGNEIYHLVEQLARGVGELSVKLVNGKVTFVHRRLWPLLLAAVGGPPAPAPSAATRALLSQLEARGTLEIAELRRSGSLAAADLKRAVSEVEQRLLAHVASEHTESGKHDKVLQRWMDWSRQRGLEPAALAPRAARAELATVAAALSEDGVRLQLPWK
jgi:hypothetical protein